MAVFTAIGTALGASAAAAFSTGVVATVAAGGVAAVGVSQASKQRKSQQRIAEQRISSQERVAKQQIAARKPATLLTEGKEVLPRVKEITEQAKATGITEAKKRARRRTKTILTGPRGELAPREALGRKTLLGE